MTLKTEIQVLRDSYGKFNSKLECFERQYETLQRRHEHDKEAHNKAMKDAKHKLLAKSNSQSNIHAQNQINIAQAKMIEQQISALDKETAR